jgi:microcystin-dependent protein
MIRVSTAIIKIIVTRGIWRGGGTMSSPFIGEIRMFAGNFPPNGWAFCNGALLAISDNDALFNLIGTTYGGDGQTTFALPNLQSRVPVHVGPGFALAQQGGVETVTLTTSQIPAHSHVPQAFNAQGGASNPAGSVWALSTLNQFASSAPSANMAPGALGQAGGSQPHDNMIPFLAINFILSLFGVFPSQ